MKSWVDTEESFVIDNTIGNNKNYEEFFFVFLTEGV